MNIILTLEIFTYSKKFTGRKGTLVTAPGPDSCEFLSQWANFRRPWVVKALLCQNDGSAEGKLVIKWKLLENSAQNDAPTLQAHLTEKISTKICFMPSLSVKK